MTTGERFRASNVGRREVVIVMCALGFIGSIIGHADAQAVRPAATLHVVAPALASRGNEPWRYMAISTFPLLEANITTQIPR